ncbi:hypothetical protein [Caudoviricetes sp.]|nr:hypothetical protein [Caudoviricetes sp.]
MSHFTVLVIGNDFEAQLAPYHEFECTGTNDQYVQDEDITQEIQDAIDKGESIEDALGYHGLEDRIVDDESKVDTVGDKCAHKYGYAIVQDGKLIKAVNRTNPNRKWDWYQVGGRWSGFLKLKSGANGLYGQRSWANPGEDEAGYCDQGKKGDIDFDGMRNEAGDKAAKNWDLFDKHLAQFKDGFVTWSKMRERHEDIDAARNEYHAQPLRKAMSMLSSRDGDLPEEERSFFVWLEVEDYLQTREAFIQQARDKAIMTFAVVKDGQWFERGQMGWWGIVHDEKDQAEWNAKFNELLDGLSDDTLLTVVDCHI